MWILVTEWPSLWSFDVLAKDLKSLVCADSGPSSSNSSFPQLSALLLHAPVTVLYIKRPGVEIPAAMANSASLEVHNSRSPLLSLPREIRSLIWPYAFPPMIATVSFHAGLFEVDDMSGYLGPIFTCRQIYEETQELAYSSITLVVKDVPDSTYLPELINLHIFPRLRHVEIVLNSPFLEVIEGKIEGGPPDLTMLENLSQLTIRHLAPEMYGPGVAAWPQLVERMKDLNPYKLPRRSGWKRAWKSANHLLGRLPPCPVFGIADIDVALWFATDEAPFPPLEVVCPLPGSCLYVVKRSPEHAD